MASTAAVARRAALMSHLSQPRTICTWRASLRTMTVLRSSATSFSTNTRLDTKSPPTSVIDSDFWRCLIPKPLRRKNQTSTTTTTTTTGAHTTSPSREWNPATYYIVMFILVGSMAIQMIMLRKEADAHARRAAVRIALLRDVVDRIKRGEKVDVERELGTGDKQSEADWDELLRAIERGADGRSSPAKQETTETNRQANKVEPETRGQQAKTKTAGLGSFY